MIRRLLLAAALVAAAGRLAQAAICLPVAGGGPVLNGFETTGTTCTNDIGQWAITSNSGTPSLGASLASGPFTPVQGETFGYVSDSLAQTLSLTITSATCPVLAANADWTSPQYDYLFVAYQALTATAFYYEFQVVDNGAANAFRTSANVSVSGGFTFLITSLNYARNIGYDTSNVSQLSLTTLGPTGLVTDPIGIGYDNVQLGTMAGLPDTPNSQVLASDVTGSAGGCDTPVSLSWTGQTQSGTDTISGYHIYRSVSGPTGPFISDGYVVGNPSTVNFTDSVSGESATEYFAILPYSSTTANFGGSGLSGVFTGCKSATYDSVWATTDGGVNEAPLNLGATYVVGPFNALGGCTPTETATPTLTASPTSTFSDTSTATPTGTPTATPSDTSTATPTDTPSDTPSDTPTGTPTATPTGTPSLTATPTSTASATATATFTDSPTATLSFTSSDTATSTSTATPSATSTDTATASATATDTATATPSVTSSSTFTATPSFTNSPNATFTITPTGTLTASPTLTPSATVSFSATASPTFTISPTFTPGGSGVNFWPNPFYPERNTQKFHLDNVAAGQKLQIFNMIGQLVWQMTTVGGDQDYWLGLNSNGAEVTTGVYLVYYNGQVYRFAVVRN